MIVFQGEYKSLKTRIFSDKSLSFLFVYIFYSFILSVFFKTENLKYYAYFLELVFFILFITITINTSKSIISKISIDENIITLSGENFNEKWEKSLSLKETNIEVKGVPCRSGLRGVTFYIKLKNKKKSYIINSFLTFSDQEIIEIFNEFKRFKGEKIILDERLYIMRIQEKIEKWQ